jgi:hypothetical protein
MLKAKEMNVSSPDRCPSAYLQHPGLTQHRAPQYQQNLQAGLDTKPRNDILIYFKENGGSVYFLENSRDIRTPWINWH